MKYRPYRLNMEKIVKIIRQHGMIKLPKSKDIKTLHKALTWTYQNSPAKLGTMEAVIHAEELNWLNTGKTVYFPETLEMAQNIIKSVYKIESDEAFYDGDETFILNLPDGLSFDHNDKGSGIIVTITAHSDRVEIIDTFTDWVGIGRANIEVKGEQGKYTIAMNYQNVFNSDEYLRVALPSQNAIKALHMSAEEYAHYMKATNAFDYDKGFSLNDEEFYYQYEMIRLVCGFLVYKKALPERIVSGLPGINHKEVETPLTKGQDHYVIHSPKGTHEVTGHYRSWHFRNLIHKKYYQNEHKNKPIGSRVIFVSDSYVVQDVDAKTVEG